MDVQLRPPMHGCLIAIISLMTLGVYPLLRRFLERHFIRRMDDTGIETRGGKRIPWSEFTRIQRVVAKVQGVQMSDEYLLHSPRGRVSLPLWRTGNAKEAADYLQRHLPPGIRVG
ncbi:MAG: hypothetical protein IRZ13_10590 [Acetobacteraceae bacterium]|nr:hypothetical protein [Acetobacteraceae bacterium]